ncbi:hypothetical protein EUGRSUZ_F00971 [Eucalyptus grandis]|uniref:Uncharacterized protein n=3 Tax=Eucalyptus TaxID=3932 RepID=A0A059BM49_EUCGR|nr:hypothetical protein EUGRSUZ_F00971 [Eucalyptus grandis]
MGDSKNYQSENFSCDERWSSNSGQESSWTPYFVDFLMNGQEKNDSSTGHDDSSLVVSDAATSAVKKSVEIDQAGSRKRLSFKKRRKGPIDDALEDTASSPVNSPKVLGLQKTMDSYPGQEEDKLSKDDATTSGQRDKISIDLDFAGRGGGNFSELKKRGLCLVPLSMMVKYQD